MERFRAGRVIGESARLWVRKLPLLFALVTVVGLPRIAYYVYGLLAPGENGFELPEGDSTWDWLAPLWIAYAGETVVRRLFLYLSAAVAMYAVYNASGFGASLRGGLRRALPVARVALFLTLIELVVGFGITWAVFSADFWPGIWWIYGLYALIELVVAPFWVAVPVAVVERTSGDLRRSWNLTRGHRLRIFGILLLVYAAHLGSNELLGLWTLDVSQAATSIVWWTEDLLFVAFEAVLAVVAYRALRLEKEGVDVTQLEGVFA